jgi:uncharacterized protein YgiM (DUF1202 family)
MKRYRLMVFLVLLMLCISFGLTTQVHLSMAQDYGSDWTGQYYNNTSFSGSPSITRIDSNINFDYGSDSPIDGFIDEDNFSTRWTGTQTIAAATYVFTATADDGVRVIVDGTTIIDQLGASGGNTFQSTVALSGDSHSITVEHVEQTGDASISFSWQLSTSATAGPTETQGPTLTPSNTALPAIPPGAITATVIRASVLLVRDAPSLGGNVIGRVLRGQTYQIIGRDGNARWYLIQLADKIGWVWSYYIFVDGNEFSVPVSSAASASGLPAGVADTGVIGQTRAGMKLRGAPTTLTEQTGRITWGAFLPIVGRTADNTWYQVVWKGTVGWVWSNFVPIRFGDINNVPVTS